MDENPYDELEQVQTNLVDLSKAAAKLQQAKDEGEIGIQWNEWIECVQWLSTRFTKGDDAPSEWDDTYIKAMYQDLQYFSFKAVQAAIVKLHQEGRSYAPNSSQIIGMINKLGHKQVTSYNTYNLLANNKTECGAGGAHSFVDSGWIFDEVGNPIFEEFCPRTAGPEMPSCLVTRIKAYPSEENLRRKPEPMTREKFIAQMKKMKLNEKLQDEILEYRNRLQTEEELAKKTGAK
jgi:hypothetical protein